VLKDLAIERSCACAVRGMDEYPSQLDPQTHAHTYLCSYILVL
jgi:hypothetical protein